jgi:lambda family phage portal protein
MGTEAKKDWGPRPGIFERGLAHILPGLGYKRARSRALANSLAEGIERVRRYEAASGGRRTSGWVRPGSSANAEIGPALHRLRAGSRDLRRNNQWADKAIRTRADDIIGLGIRPSARSLKGKREQELINAAWKLWGGTTKCDPHGRKNFYKMQDLTMQAADESGEVLLRRMKCSTADGLPVPLQIKVMEADHLDTLKDGQILENGNRVIQGVEYDGRDRPVAYWIFPDHPGENYHTRSIKSDRVPAEDIIHLFDEIRPGQVRGIPRGTPCLLRTRDFDDMEDAVLLRQKLANLYVGFIHDLDATVETNATFSEADVDEMEPGTYEHLPAGRTISFANPPHAQGYSDYSKISLRAIAAGYGTTYEALTGDLTQVNFSSGRMGRLQYERANAKFRENTIVPVLCHRVWEWFVEAAVLAGHFSDENATAVWTPPGAAMIDPVKEINAKAAAIRNGFTTQDAVIREFGGEPEDIMEEQALGRRRAEEMDVPLDIYAPAPGAAAAPPDPEDGPETEPGEEPDEDPEDDQDQDPEKDPEEKEPDPEAE